MMISPRAWFAPAILCAAALSFAAGRVFTAAGSAPEGEATAWAVPNDIILEARSVTLPPAHVPDVVALPFAETYQVLKGAPPDVLRSYCAELQQLPVGPARNAALTAFFRALIQANPAMARDLILSLKKDDRWLPYSAIRSISPPRGMEAVAEILLSFDRIEISSCSYDLLGEALDDWGKNDPLALKQFLEAHRDQDVEGYFDNLVHNWAAYDPEAARQWMEKEIEKRPLIPNRPREDGGEEIFDGSWRTTVEEMAKAWILGLLANDVEAGVSYVIGHLDDPLVAKSIFWVAGDLFLMSPERARDFVLHVPEEQKAESLDAIGNKADALVRSDASENTTSPRYLAEWILQFPPQTRSRGMESALRQWQTANPQELFAWMADLPPQSREAVVQAYPAYVSAESAQEDFDSIMQAGDLVLRQQLLEKIMGEARDARAAMLAVLEASQLSAEQKSHLASLIPQKAVSDSDGE